MESPLLEAGGTLPVRAGAENLERSSTRPRVGFRNRDILFTFANAILVKGSSRTLEQDDVEDMLDEDDTWATRRGLIEAWDARRAAGRPSLVRSFFDCWSGIFWAAFAIHVLETGLMFVAPQMIKGILSYVASPGDSLSVGIAYALAMYLGPCFQAVASANFNIHARRLGFRLSGATACMVFEKVLRLSQAGAASYGPGKLANVMSTDTYRLQFAPFYFIFMFSMPMMLVIGTTLMYQNLQAAAFMPIIITAVMYPVNQWLTRTLMKNGRLLNFSRDARVKLLTEVLHALELVKQLAWEAHVKGMVDAKRREEMKQLAYQKLLGVLNGFIWQGLPTLLPLATIGTYAAFGGALSPGIVFASLALLDMTTFPMKVFPESLQWLVQAKIGVDRIERLLLAEERVVLLPEESPPEGAREDTAAYVRSEAMPAGTPSVAIKSIALRWAVAGDTEEAADAAASGGIAAWWRRRASRAGSVGLGAVDVEAPSVSVSMVSGAPLPPTLSVAAMDIYRGKLVFVVGPVGCGKSTLLHGLLNEVPLVSGRIQISGSVAYCAQKPWILNETVRENILLGRAYNREKFNDVVAACALEPDMKQLQKGAATLIGERGVNVSGGQKARVSLARTAYAGADLNLLDDPLAAVDPHVAAHLLERCIVGYLAGTTRILVTHQLHFMDRADLVVVVCEGEALPPRPPADFTAEEREHLGGHLRSEAADDVDSAPDPTKLELKRALSGPAGFEEDRAAPGKPALRRAQSGPARGPERPVHRRHEDEEVEDRQVGAVKLRIWGTYARVMGPLAASALMFSYAASNSLQLAAMYWLAHWSASTNDGTVVPLLVYALLSLGAVAMITCRSFLFRWTSLRVSATLHDGALWAVMRAPKSWLDTTPTGRIVNRFSQDLQKLDTELQGMCNIFIDSILKMAISVGLVLALIPSLLLVLLPLLYLYLKVQKIFRDSSRELRRLSSVSKSPIYQNLDQVIAGVATIRAFKKERDFIWKNAELNSRNLAIDFANTGIGRWMGLRLRFLGMAFVLGVTLFVVIWSRNLSAALVGLALRYALDLSSSMEGMIQTLTMTEQGLIALERLNSFSQLASEPELELPGEVVDPSWPAAGEITFDGVWMRYRPDLPQRLKGVSFNIPGGSSAGVVGRTGSGKSTMLVALFRLCELESGAIRIDGVNTSTIGLHTLRRKLAIIPQEAIGFTGSLRFNLDPFSERNDEDIWAELEKVQLKTFAETHGLDYHLTAGGENLSVGQRQLLCAARAFLQNTRILALDEATASVDFQTDTLIQQVLKDEVATRGLTTLTIAHRINTIMESDRVLVLDQGKVLEFGPTRKLAEDPSSTFYTFVHP